MSTAMHDVQHHDSQAPQSGDQPGGAIDPVCGMQVARGCAGLRDLPGDALSVLQSEMRRRVPQGAIEVHHDSGRARSHRRLRRQGSSTPARCIRRFVRLDPGIVPSAVWPWSRSHLQRLRARVQSSSIWRGGSGLAWH